MRARHVLAEGIAQGPPAAGDGAQFGHDAGGGFIVARILDDAELPLHTEPIHGYRLILPEQAPALGTPFRKIRFGIQSPPAFIVRPIGASGEGCCIRRYQDYVYNLNEDVRDGVWEETF